MAGERRAQQRARQPAGGEPRGLAPRRRRERRPRPRSRTGTSSRAPRRRSRSARCSRRPAPSGIRSRGRAQSWSRLTVAIRTDHERAAEQQAHERVGRGDAGEQQRGEQRFGAAAPDQQREPEERERARRPRARPACRRPSRRRDARRRGARASRGARPRRSPPRTTRISGQVLPESALPTWRSASSLGRYPSCRIWSGISSASSAARIQTARGASRRQSGRSSSRCSGADCTAAVVRRPRGGMQADAPARRADARAVYTLTVIQRPDRKRHESRIALTA